MPRILVAGVGNIFLRDDGFGPEAVRRLAGRTSWSPPDGTRVVDYGIRGMHLAYDLDGYDALVLVDAMPNDDVPGSITVLRIGPEELVAGEWDGHGMNPIAVLGSIGMLGGEFPPTYLVGCRPVDVRDGIGLSPTVSAALDEAADTIAGLVEALAADASPIAIRQG